MNRLINQFLIIILLAMPCTLNAQATTDYSRLSAEGIVNLIDKLLDNPAFINNYIRPIYGNNELSAENFKQITSNLIYAEAVKLERFSELLPKDSRLNYFEKIVKLYETSANRDFSEANLRLGHIYFNGEFGRRIDFDSALNFYQKYLNILKTNNDAKPLPIILERIQIIENQKTNNKITQESDITDLSRLSTSGIINSLSKLIKNPNFINSNVKLIFPNQEITNEILNFVFGSLIFKEAEKLEGLLNTNVSDYENLRKYMDLLLLASKNGSFEADFYLGNLYNNGDFGTKRDLNLSLSYFQKSLDNKFNNNSNMKELAKERVIYLVNFLGKNKDKSNAIMANNAINLPVVPEVTNFKNINFDDLPDYSFLSPEAMLATISKLVDSEAFINSKIKPILGNNQLNNDLKNNLINVILFREVGKIDKLLEKIKLESRPALFAKEIQILKILGGREFNEAFLRLGNIYFLGELGQTIDLSLAQQYYQKILANRTKNDPKLIAYSEEKLNYIDRIRKGVTRHPTNPDLVIK